MDSSLIAVSFQSNTAQTRAGLCREHSHSGRAVVASALQSLPTVSIVIFIFGREMRVEVAVHSVLRNHSVAERALVRTAALRRRHLCPHVDRIIAPLRAPEKLQGQPEKEKYIIYGLQGSSARSIKARWTIWLLSIGHVIGTFWTHPPISPSSCTNTMCSNDSDAQVLNYFTIFVFRQRSKQSHA